MGAGVEELTSHTEVEVGIYCPVPYDQKRCESGRSVSSAWPKGDEERESMAEEVVRELIPKAHSIMF